jgi:hypothetical protein
MNQKKDEEKLLRLVLEVKEKYGWDVVMDCWEIAKTIHKAGLLTSKDKQ